MWTTSCVLCGDPSERLMVQHGIPILGCGSCRHRFAEPPSSDRHVEEVYGEGYFFGGKDGYPNYLDEAPLLVSRGRKYARQLREFTRPGRQLDVGAAAGFILKGFRDAGWSGTGLEPNAAMVRYGQRELGLRMVRGTLETCRFERQFDLISMIQVIAHLNDLPSAFDALRRLAKQDGLLLIETWNHESLTARLLGKYWHEYSPPSVLHWFTPDTLAAALRPHGFERIAEGRTLKWISLRHGLSLASHVLGQKASAALQRQVPRSWRVPYPSEDLFWALYRAK